METIVACQHRAGGDGRGPPRAALRKYAPDLECTQIQRAEGTGIRPAALLTFTGKRVDSLGKLRLRLDGMYWKGRKLACSTTVM
jgi:hypothetical protein